MTLQTCCKFDVAKSAIDQLHHHVFVTSAPQVLPRHQACCLWPTIQSASAYVTTFLRRKENKQSVKKFTKTVNKSRNALCTMINQLHAYQQWEGVSEKEKEFYLQCNETLYAASNEIEFCFSTYCRSDVQIPLPYLNSIAPVLRSKMDDCKKIFYQSNMDQALVLALLKPVADCIAMQNNTTVSLRNLLFAEKMFAAIEKNAVNGKITEENLLHILLDINFNDRSVIKYYGSWWQKQLDQWGNVVQKQDFICNRMNDLFIHTLSVEEGLHKDRAPMAAELLSWLLYQSQYWSGVQTDSSLSARAQRKQQWRESDDTNVLLFNVGCGVAARVFDYLHSSGIIRGTKKSIMRFVAKHGSFPNAENPNPEYLLKALKKYESEADKALLLLHLPLWFELAGGKMPGSNNWNYKKGYEKDME